MRSIVLVDPSTWTNLNKFEPGTNDRDYFVKIKCAAKPRTDLVFVHRLDCKELCRISSVSPHSAVSLDCVHELPENTFPCHWNLPWLYIPRIFTCKQLYTLTSVRLPTRSGLQTSCWWHYFKDIFFSGCPERAQIHERRVAQIHLEAPTWITPCFASWNLAPLFFVKLQFCKIVSQLSTVSFKFSVVPTCSEHFSKIHFTLV